MEIIPSEKQSIRNSKTTEQLSNDFYKKAYNWSLTLLKKKKKGCEKLKE